MNLSTMSPRERCGQVFVMKLVFMALGQSHEYGPKTVEVPGLSSGPFQHLPEKETKRSQQWRLEEQPVSR